MRLIVLILFSFLLVSCVPTASDNSDKEAAAKLAGTSATNTTIFQKFLVPVPAYSSYSYTVNENSSFLTSVQVQDITGSTLTGATGQVRLEVFSDYHCSLAVAGGYTGTATATVSNGVATFSNFGLTKPAAAAYAIRYIKISLNSAQSACSPPIRVNPMIISYSLSTVTLGAASGGKDSTTTVTVTLRNTAGAQVTTGGHTVVLSQSGGTSGITLGSITDNVNGTYTATLTADSKGTARTISATVQGSTLTSAFPTYTVTNTAPVIQAIANQTVQQYLSAETVNFTVTDVDGDAINCATSGTVTSSNDTYFDDDTAVLSGTAPNCVLSMPTMGSAGTATVSVEYSDGTGNTTENFDLEVLSPAILQIVEAPIYGSVIVNYPMTKTFTVQNIGQEAATILTIQETFSGNFSYSPTGGDCFDTGAHLLATGGTCTFEVIYRPSAEATDENKFSFHYHDGVGTRRFSQMFAGRGEALKASRTNGDFGSVRIGSEGHQLFSIINPSEHSVDLSVVLAGTANPDGTFQFAGGGVFPGSFVGNYTTKPCGPTLAAQSSCQIVIGYIPTGNGGSSETVFISNTAGAASPVTQISLSASGYADANACDCTLDANDITCGSGVPGDPWLICSPGHFSFLHANFDALRADNFKLVSDVDMTTQANLVIGRGSAFQFSGTIDGNGYTLSNLSYTNNGETNVGLFEYLNASTIRNLKFISSTVNPTSSNQVGLLAGYANNVNLDNVQAFVNVSGTSSGYVGGLFGRAYISNLINVLVIATYTPGATITLYGGLSGAMGGSNINDSEFINSGNLGAVADRFGGLVGYHSGPAIIDHVGVDNTIEEGLAVGGIGGVFVSGNLQVDQTTISNTFTGSATQTKGGAFAAITNLDIGSTHTLNNLYVVNNSNGTIVGGAIGQITMDGPSTVTIQNSKFFNNIEASQAGGVIGRLVSGHLNLTDNFIQFNFDDFGASYGAGIVARVTSAHTINIVGQTVLTEQIDTAGPSGGIGGSWETADGAINVGTTNVYGKITSSGDVAAAVASWDSPAMSEVKTYASVHSTAARAAGAVAVLTGSTTDAAIRDSVFDNNIYGTLGTSGLVVQSQGSGFSFTVSDNQISGSLNATGAEGAAGLFYDAASDAISSEKNVIALDSFFSSSAAVFPFANEDLTNPFNDYMWLYGTASSVEKAVWLPTANAGELFYDDTQMIDPANFSDLDLVGEWSMGGYYTFPVRQ